MLIAVRFKNFRSFRDRGDLSLIASKTENMLQSCLLRPDDEDEYKRNTLPVIAIYGANSAGKTNVLRAIEYIQRAIVNSQAKWLPGKGTGIETFFMQKSVDGLSTLEMDFVLGGLKYSYGFAVCDSHFEEEWLLSYNRNRDHIEFKRSTLRKTSPNTKMPSFETRVDYGSAFDQHEDYRIGLTGRVRENSLLLSAAAQDNNPLCRKIYDWFSQNFDFENIANVSDRTHAMITARLLQKEGAMKQSVLSLMRVADPTLRDIRVMDSDPLDYNHPLMESISGELKKYVDLHFALRIEFISKIGKRTVSLPFEAQSRGFQKLFAIAVRINFALHLGNVLVVDEIESSIHPHLARYIVDLFQNREINTGGGQLVCSTHDTSLLDQSLLRRDQIWFVEKKHTHSHLYSLIDYVPHDDETLERGYLRGRYGAIPALGLDPASFKM